MKQKIYLLPAILKYLSTKVWILLLLVSVLNAQNIFEKGASNVVSKSDLDILDRFSNGVITTTKEEEVNAVISNMPISFRMNEGQWDEDVLFRGSSPGWNSNINFLKDGLSFSFSRGMMNTQKEVMTNREREFMVWNLYFKGANENVHIAADGRENSHTNYLLNPDVNKQQFNVSDYKTITYKSLYNNIDLRYYSLGKELKYDYVINSNGNISQIQMDCQGIEELQLNDKGQLEIITKWGKLIEEIPESYQIIDGEKKRVRVEYKIINRTTFGFSTSERYDSQIPLIIDPVNLAWCTMVGSDSGNGYIMDITIDSDGNVYGVTEDGGGSYPTTPGVYSTRNFSGYNTYVFKLSSDASALVWATYLSTGSDNLQYFGAIEIDVQGNVYICGRTKLTNNGNLITTPGAYSIVYSGTASSEGNGYLIKLNSTGSNMLYSTFLGSPSATEHAYDLAVSKAGLIYIVGYTKGNSFPTTSGALDVTYNGGQDVFFSVISPAGLGAGDLVYSTYIGGIGNEYGLSLAIDDIGNAYISGSTTSVNFPVTAGSLDPLYNGSGDAFVCKIKPVGSGISDMIYSTFVGGTAADEGRGIVINGLGETFLVGSTSSSDFPVTAGAYDVAYGGANAIFVLKLDALGSSFLYSTYIDNLTSPKIALSRNSCEKDEVFISGITPTSSSFSPPITSCAYMTTSPGSIDIVLLKLKTAGTGMTDLLYSTYFGGNAQDYNSSGVPICLNGKQEVFMAYTTHSTNTPTTPGVYMPIHISGNDQPVVLKMKPSAPELNYTYTTDLCNNTISFSGLASGSCIWQQTWAPNFWSWDFGDGQTSSLQNPSHIFAFTGSYNVKLIVGCPKDSITKIVTINSTVAVTTTIVNSSCVLSNGSGTAIPVGGLSPYTYSWSDGQKTATATGLGAGIYAVTVVDANGCIGQKTVSINASGPLTVSITSANGTCTTLGSATVNSLGGTPSYSYSWSDGQVTQTATNLIGGIYTVTVSDAGSCSLTQSVTILPPPAFIVNISAGKQATCGLNNGSSTVLASNGTPPYSYLWSIGQTTQVATGLAAGNYVVTVSDVNGCAAVKKVTVIAIPPSSFTYVINNGTCGNGGNAKVDVSWGVLPFTYSWSGTSQTTNSATALAAGNYTVVITDGNACITTKSLTITDTPGNIATFIQSPVGVACVGSPIDFINTGTPAATGITYSWEISPITPTNVSGTTTDFSYTFLSAGNYNVSHTVISSGCTNQIVSNVKVIDCSVPSVTATSDSICSGLCANVISSPLGGTLPYTYSWSTGETSQNINPCPVSTTSYTLMVTDSGGKTATTIVRVTVNPTVTAISRRVWPGDADNDGVANNNDLLAIGVGYGTSGTTRCNASTSWTGQPSWQWPQALITGTNYKHVDCDGNGAINSADTLPIHLNYGSTHPLKIAAPKYIAGIPDLYIKCLDDTVWAGSTTKVQIGLGTVSTQANNVYGAAFSIDFNDLNLIDISGTIFSPLSSWLGTKGTNLISLYHIDMSANNLNFGICKTDHVNNTGNGEITELVCKIPASFSGPEFQMLKFSPNAIKVIANDGNVIPVNSVTDSIVIRKLVTNIDETREEDKLIITPNPFGDETLIQFKEINASFYLIINDIAGREISSIPIEKGQTRYILHRDDLSEGIYILRAIIPEGVVNRKIIVH